MRLNSEFSGIILFNIIINILCCCSAAGNSWIFFFRYKFIEVYWSYFSSIVYPFPKSLLEFITKNFPNPKSEVNKDSLGFAFLKQLVSTKEQRPSWEFIRQKFSGSNLLIEMPIVVTINIEAENPSGTHFNMVRFTSFRWFVSFSKYPTTANKNHEIKIIATRTCLVFSKKSIFPTFI